jgi:arsenate reductase
VNKPSIVFVCIENSCRSQLAEAYGHLHGGDEFHIFSAGSKPSGLINPKAVEAMADVGYALGSHTSSSLDSLPDISFAAAITMGCGDECPNVQAQQREEWSIPDPKHLDAEGFARVRDDIEQRILALFERLRRKP